jgi:uncharacterized membrane protein
VANALDKIELPTIAVLFFFLFGIVFWGLQLLISIGVIKIALRFVSGSTSKLKELFSGAGLIINYVVSSVLYGLVVFFGFILLVVPGIIFAVRFQFYQYLVVDKNMGPIEALKVSWHITDGSFWNLVLYWLLVAGINILGILALGIGLLATIPTTVVATAWVYKKLSQKSHA